MSEDIIRANRLTAITSPESPMEWSALTTPRCIGNGHSFTPPDHDGTEHIVICECGETACAAAFLDGHWRMRFSDVF